MSEIALPPIAFMGLVSGTISVDSFLSAGLGVRTACAENGLLGAGARFLDVGCGCGRVARTLIQDPIGAYVGFDRHWPMISWARREIASADPRFQFDHFAVTSHYDHIDGVEGTVDVKEFRWPYEDNSFDSVLLASVFSHMPMDEIRVYMRQIHRVLAPGGKVFASYLLKHQVEAEMEGFNYLFDPEEIETMLREELFEARFVEETSQAWWVATPIK